MLNEYRRHTVFTKGCPCSDRAVAARAEALGRGIQGADGGKRKDADGAGQLLEGAQAADPQQGVHSRLSSSCY